jgi:REP element-mobilizing transposase RayT
MPLTRFVYEGVEVHKRRRLPHWETRGGLYLVTFRLEDAVPHREAARLEERLDAIRRQLLHLDERDREAAISRLRVRAIERPLDRGHGACHLKRADLAELVAGALGWYKGATYDLLAWAVMPNHVHVIFKLLGESTLSGTLKAWKSYTGHRATKLLGVRHFWHEEYFDTLIRDSRHLDRSIRYVIDNPLKAGLRDWRWVGQDEGVISRVMGG